MNTNYQRREMTSTQKYFLLIVKILICFYLINISILDAIYILIKQGRGFVWERKYGECEGGEFIITIYIKKLFNLK